MTPTGAHSIALCTTKSPLVSVAPRHTTTGRGRRLPQRVRIHGDEPSLRPCRHRPIPLPRQAVVHPHLAEEHQRMALTCTLTRGGGRLRALLLVALSFAFGACDGTDKLTNAADETTPASALPAASSIALFASSSTGRRIPFGVSHGPPQKPRSDLA